MFNSYKQVAGQAIFEIGKRLKHVKENDLVHGEFGKWLESIEMSPRQAQRFMKIAEELKENTTLGSQLGIKALYELATLPEEEREKEHALSNLTTSSQLEESDPIKKSRIANFLKEYWGVKNGNRSDLGENCRGAKDIAKFIGANERTARSIIKLNDLIPQLQELVSSKQLGTTAAEQNKKPQINVTHSLSL